MPSSNGKHSIHANMLRPSGTGIKNLNQKLAPRFIGLLETYFRVNNVKLCIPSYLDADMFLWRTMAVRHKKGDFRNTKDEEKAIMNVADWMLRENCSLRNQEYVPTEWGC